MTRLLFFILFLGFFMQCTGTAVYVKKSIVKTAQCPDDNHSSEEKSGEEFKKDTNQIEISYITTLYAATVVYAQAKYTKCYPGGFFSKPYLPPR